MARSDRSMGTSRTEAVVSSKVERAVGIVSFKIHVGNGFKVAEGGMYHNVLLAGLAGEFFGGFHNQVSLSPYMEKPEQLSEDFGAEGYYSVSFFRQVSLEEMSGVVGKYLPRGIASRVIQVSTR